MLARQLALRLVILQQLKLRRKLIAPQEQVKQHQQPAAHLSHFQMLTC